MIECKSLASPGQSAQLYIYLVGGVVTIYACCGRRRSSWTFYTPFTHVFKLLRGGDGLDFHQRLLFDLTGLTSSARSTCARRHDLFFRLRVFIWFTLATI